MKIKFLGAAKTVTGSCYLLDIKGHKILIDFGMFQGEGLEEKNRQPLDFDTADIEYVLLTHAHIDHSGRLPLLLQNPDTKAKILSTRPTNKLSRMMLLDSAGIQEEEAKYLNRKNKRKNLPEVTPLYTYNEVVLLDFFELDYNQRYQLFDGVSFVFKEAGHVLGASFIELDINEDGENKKIIFSGDLGNKDKPIIRDPQLPNKADAIIIETTYGNRLHRSIEDSIEELKEVIKYTLKRDGKVIIPSFSLERTQELLFIFNQFYHEGIIPKDVLVFLDSPLAINLTDVFIRYKDYLDEESLEKLKEYGSIFKFENLKMTKSTQESKLINEYKSRAIILAGSGMCTGGRIMHHLKHNLWNKYNSVVFVGYQAKGTLGREIIEGAKEVNIYGEQISVQADIYTINGFSAHADRDGLTEWLLPGVKENTKIFLTHGEVDVIESFAKHLKDNYNLDSYAPEEKEEIEL